jgi:hypothetical protein
MTYVRRGVASILVVTVESPAPSQIIAELQAPRFGITACNGPSLCCVSVSWLGNLSVPARAMAAALGRRT